MGRSSQFGWFIFSPLNFVPLLFCQSHSVDYLCLRTVSAANAYNVVISSVFKQILVKYLRVSTSLHSSTLSFIQQHPASPSFLFLYLFSFSYCLCLTADSFRFILFLCLFYSCICGCSGSAFSALLFQLSLVSSHRLFRFVNIWFPHPMTDALPLSIECCSLRYSSKLKLNTSCVTQLPPHMYVFMKSLQHRLSMFI